MALQLPVAMAKVFIVVTLTGPMAFVAEETARLEIVVEVALVGGGAVVAVAAVRAISRSEVLSMGGCLRCGTDSGTSKGLVGLVDTNRCRLALFLVPSIPP